MILKYFYKLLTNSIGHIIIPILVNKRLKRGKEHIDRYTERYGIASLPRPKNKDIIWLHGASIGETTALLPLIERLSKAYHILLTYQTVTAAELMDRIITENQIDYISHQFIPYDLSIYSKKFLEYWQPSHIIFSESEIWLNLFDVIKQKNIAHYFVNARARKKSIMFWVKYHPNIISHMRAVFVQHDSDIALWQKLYPSASYIGNLKTIITPESLSLHYNKQDFDDIKNAIGKRPIWLAAMLHHGEEDIIIQTHHIIKQHYPNLLTMILLRHHHNTSNMIMSIGNASYQLRDTLPSDKDDYYIINSYGETDLFYALNDIIVLMGSFKDFGGHNPIPALRHGCFLLCGPDMKNAQSLYESLSAHDLIKRCDNPQDIADNVISFLQGNQNTCTYADNLKKFTISHGYDMIDNIVQTIELSQ